MILPSALLSTSCFFKKANVPMYDDMKPDPELGYVLDIDGMVYRTLPETLWKPDEYNYDSVKVGKLDSKNNSFGIYAFESDVDRIFIKRIYDKPASHTPVDWFYRADIDLPGFNASNTNSLSFSQKGNHTKEEPFNNIVTDKKTINAVFDSLDYASERPEVGNRIVGILYLNNSTYKGICVVVWAIAYEDKYWLSIRDGGRMYAEIPHELMEEIVGEKMPPANEYTELWFVSQE